LSDPARALFTGAGWGCASGLDAGCARQQLISWPGRQQAAWQWAAAGFAGQTDGRAASMGVTRSAKLQRRAKTAFIRTLCARGAIRARRLLALTG
jgi:hypothetical protein